MRYIATFEIIADSADRRAAKGLLQRALRPWGAKYARWWHRDYGITAQFTFEATLAEFDAAEQAVRELALAEGWTGPPCHATIS